MTRLPARPAAWVPRGPYIGTIHTVNGDGAGHPTVDVAELGASNLQTHGTLLDFDPATGAGGGPAHTHPLTGPTFHVGDRVLVDFLGGNQDRPVVLGRFG